MTLAINNLLARAFEGKEVRFVLNEHKEPWFVGRDIASMLGYKKPNDAIRKKLDDEDKLEVRHFGSLDNLHPQTILINKSAIIQLYTNSKLPSAKRFKRWIFDEVIPSIMQTGRYEASEEKKQELTDMDKLLAVENAKTKRTEIECDAKLKELTINMADKEKDRIDRNLAKAQELIPNDPQIIEATKIRAVSEAVPKFFEVSHTLFLLGLSQSQVRTMAPVVGRDLKKYWVETRNEKPPQYMKYVNGDNRLVNHYPYECKDEIDVEIERSKNIHAEMLAKKKKADCNSKSARDV